jgi:ABC-type amino acid transport substrate-binding protein
VPVDRERLAAQLNAGDCDILISGIALTPDRAAQLSLSVPYRSETVAVVVPSHRRQEFRSRDAIQEHAGLRIGILGDPYFTTRIRDALPRVDWIELSSPREFFEGAKPALDAFLFTAEAGSAWTLLYPRFAVVVPQPGLLSIPLAYAVARGDQELLDYVNAWLELKQKDRTVERLYDYWILGRGAAARQPRWSVIRDVLHWVK